VLSSKSQQFDERSILVRVIVTEDAESRDRIIRATNSQTDIPSASLRATDKIHRDIEDFFATRGFSMIGERISIKIRVSQYER